MWFLIYEKWKIKMVRRVTIMLEDDLVKKLRIKQSKMLQETNDTVSFSRVINDTLRSCLKIK